MAELTTTMIVKVVVPYDAARVTEHDAQQHWLDCLPASIHDSVAIVGGEVGADGAPVFNHRFARSPRCPYTPARRR